MLTAVHFANFTLRGGPEAIAATLAATARAADQGGCSTFTLMDHYFQMESLATAQDPMLEGYTSLGFLAGQTERIQLGLLVTGSSDDHGTFTGDRLGCETTAPAAYEELLARAAR